jgi:glycine dehydrogenase
MGHPKEMPSMTNRTTNTSRRPTYCELTQSDEFIRRHIGPSAADQAGMLGTLGLSSMGELVDKVVPSSIRSRSHLALGHARSEAQVLEDLRGIASKN